MPLCCVYNQPYGLEGAWTCPTCKTTNIVDRTPKCDCWQVDSRHLEPHCSHLPKCKFYYPPPPPSTWDIEGYPHCTSHDEECEPCRARPMQWLGANLEIAAALTIARQLGAQQGWTNRDVLAKFGEPAGDADVSDYRPVQIG